MRSYKTKYTQTAIYILLLIAAFTVMGMTRRCTSASSLPSLVKGDSEGDTLDIAVVYGPLSYYVYADTLGGLNYDMLNEMGRETGLKIKLWPVAELHEALASLENRKFDILASLPADTDIKKRFLTSKSVFLDRLVLIQLKDSGGNVRINSPLDLGADTVFIEKESPAGLRLANLSEEIDTQIPVKEVNLSEEYLCMKVATGEFPLAVVNEKTAKKMELQYPSLSYENPVSFTQFQVWLLPDNDTILLKKVNNWLDSFLETETYKELISRYNL